MISGPWIAVATVVVLFGFVFLLSLAPALEIWAGEFLARQKNIFVRYLLLIPAILIWLICRLVDIFVFICALFVGFQVLKGTRNWWHKRD